MSETLERPAGVTFLSIFVLCMTAWHAIGAYSAIVHWEILKEFGAPPAYLAIKGLAWAAAGLGLAYALWAGKQPAFIAGLALAGVYLVWYWGDRLLAQPSPALNAGFSLAVSGFLAALFVVILLRSKGFFYKT